MQMISEAIETIKDLAIRSKDVEIIPIDKNNPSTVYVYKYADGSITEYTTATPPRSHRLTTIPSFAAAFASYGSKASSVFVCLTDVVAVLDDEAYRQSRLTLPVAPSPVFQTVANMTGPASQKQLLGILRHDLRPCDIAPDTLEVAVANLRWEFHDVTESAIGTVKSTMGRNVNAEVKGEGAIPLEITITFHPFPALAEQIETLVSVDCSVSIDAEAKAITVRALPGQIDLAKAAAVESLRACIAKAINDDGSRVFSGTVG